MNNPGWYPSPHYPGTMQYWDGNDWTPQIRSSDSTEAYPQNAGRKTVRIQKKMGALIGAAFFFMFAAIPLLITAPTVIDSLSSDSHKVETAGKVVDFDYSTIKKRSGTSNTWKKSCAAIAEFTADGAAHKAKSSLYTYPCEWEIGQQVSVKYDDRHPDSGASVGASSGSMVVMWGFFILGLLSAVVSLGLLIWSFTLKNSDKMELKSK